MFVPEPHYRRKRKNSSFGLWFVLFLVVLSIPAYLFGPRLYYQFADDPIARLQKRSDAYAELIFAGKSAPGDLLEYLEDSRRIAAIIEKDRPTDAVVHFHQGLYDFHELALRLSLDAAALLSMTGRGVLPVHQELEGIKAIPIEALARKCAVRMRKVLSFNPEFRRAAAVRMVIVYGDLLYAARTDPVLLDLLEKSKGTEIAPALRPYHDWISLALFAFLGERKKLDALTEDLEKSASKTGGDDFDVKRIAIKPNEMALLRAFGAFNGRNYLGALRLVRKLGRDKEAPAGLRAEAYRIQGEIFLIQRGPRLAEYWLREALKLGQDRDEFIKFRIKEIQESGKRKK